jgi:uncharacterized DUF497 family protein
MIQFEWSAAKAAANVRKHGVTFEEARTVFYDEAAVQFFDEAHSTSEDRFILLGMSSEARVLVVCHCERDGDVIRIISARRATANERRYYPAGTP